MNDAVYYYWTACILVPASVMFVILAAFDVLALFRRHSRSGVYWCWTTPLSYFDLLTTNPCHEIMMERIMEQRCVWYQVHMARVLPNVTKQDNCRNLLARTIINSSQNHLEINSLLWTTVKCCLIRLQETPRFLHEQYPQPRDIFYAFLMHSTPELLDTKSKRFVCDRLESLLLVLGVVKIHDSGCYSVRRLLREPDLSSHASDHFLRSSWRFRFWMFLRKHHHHQIMFFPRLALHLGLHPALAIQLLSENDVIGFYIQGSSSPIDATRRFLNDLSDALDGWGTREGALISLRKWDVLWKETVSRQNCDEIPALCDEANHPIRTAVALNRPGSGNLDFVEAQAYIACAYLNFGAYTVGFERLEAVYELLDKELSKVLEALSQSLRSLALVALARHDVKKRNRSETNEPRETDTGRLIGEQLFTIHLKLKASPSKSTLLAMSVPLCGAVSNWKREFSQPIMPPCWETCQNEIKSLIQVSRIGFQALESISTHFFDDSANEQQRSEFQSIISCLSQTCV